MTTGQAVRQKHLKLSTLESLANSRPIQVGVANFVVKISPNLMR